MKLLLSQENVCHCYTCEFILIIVDVTEGNSKDPLLRNTHLIEK